MQFLKQSTASQEISLGYFLDATDGNTEETALTIANTDIKLRKGGATTLTSKNLGGATHISNGVYHTTLDATDTNTLGMLEVYVHVTGALAVKTVFTVLPAASYDALITNGLNNLAATDVVSSGAITTAAGAVSTVSSVTNGVTVSTNNDKSGYAITGTLTTLDALDTAQDSQHSTTQTAITNLNDPTAATIAGTVWSDTTRTLTAGTNISLAKGTGVTGFNDVSTADILASGDVDGYSVEEILKLMAAALAGTLSGAATSTITITAVDGSKARLTATVDASGNRSAIVKDATG